MSPRSRSHRGWAGAILCTTMPVQEPDPQGPAALVVAAILAMLAHISRMLMRGWPGFIRFAAGVLGAGVSGVVFGAAIIATSTTPVPSELIWAAGGAVGWIGGDLLESIARWIMRKLGLDERKKEE